MKTITVALEVSESFVRLLNANVQLSGRIDQLQDRDVAGVLAGIFLLEARGATEEQVHAAIPPTWRPEIAAVSELRTVTERN